MAGYLFEWDVAKAETNRRKHGVTFDEAVRLQRTALRAAAESERYLDGQCTRPLTSAFGFRIVNVYPWE
jgi:uncharacterized DUF497 family protein